jgi:copper chaperone
MHEFKVPNMSCGGCASRIQAALKRVDPDSTIVVNIPGRQVQVTSHADRQSLSKALADAGYAPAA